MREHFKPPVKVAVPLMVCSLSPLDHCGIESKIRQRDEFRALYGFVSSFMCAYVCVRVLFFFAGPGPLPSRKTKHLRRGLEKLLNVRPTKYAGLHRRRDVSLLMHMITNFSDSFAMCNTIHEARHNYVES